MIRGKKWIRPLLCNLNSDASPIIKHNVQLFRPKKKTKKTVTLSKIYSTKISVTHVETNQLTCTAS